jgi:3''-phosphoadenosine 5''-phosphosulfate sulfotransferase (PAPS reductase)/FAD synthetase and related enzymes
MMSQNQTLDRDQLVLFEEKDGEFDPLAYDRYIVALSGGKDSIGALLHLLEEGVEREKIEVWHHLVDGRESDRLMDWPVTENYCQTIAEGLDVPIYFSWKVGGFKGEMLREEEKTAAVRFETPAGEIREVGGDNGSKNTRRMFPQVSGNLQVRWCSSYLKMMVASTAIRHQKRFEWGRTLFLTGERAEESAKRAKQDELEPHDADLRDGSRKQRYVDHWRPMHEWTEEEVWDLLREWKINPHPAYRLGWGRCSCMWCIFGSNDQFASAAEIDPEMARRIAEYEEEFGTTIKRDRSVPEMTEQGSPYDMDQEDIEAALSETFDEPAFVDDWSLPKGAFGDTAGPS